MPEADHPELEALIRMEVACRLALESLPELPPAAEKRLRVPIQTLCDVTQTELARLKPALEKRAAGVSRTGAGTHRCGPARRC